jgi:acetyltransferase-like isoleucine patch superfamily enzyme
MNQKLKDSGYYLALTFLNRVVAFIPSHTIRRALYKNVFHMQIEKSAFIGMHMKILSPWKIHIGRNAFINNGCFLDGRCGITIGKNVNISWDACILTLQHDPDDPLFSTIGASVQINEYAWIATKAMVMPGVRIGKGAIVGANSVVTKDVDDYAIVAGNPARFIRKRSQDLIYSLERIRFIDWAI